MAFTIEPLRYQSNSIAFESWVTLLTVCLAPLIAHIFAGASRVSYLVPSRPRWHDRMCLYNPISIIYRYAAIVERRIRAYHWESIDIAGANAIFWTQYGWDGSENMVVASLPFCGLLPDGTTVGISVELFKTIITTFQGAQTATILFGGLNGAVSFDGFLAMDSIFISLALLGLLRLFAAMWLVDDFVYSARILTTEDRTPPITEIQMQPIVSMDSLLLEPEIFATAHDRYHHTLNWRIVLFRTIYLSIILGLCFLAGSWMFRSKVGHNQTPYLYTTTSFLDGLGNLLIILPTALVYGYYSIRNRMHSTIVPCIAHLWFKVHTVICIVFVMMLIFISALETRQTPCGRYTTWPKDYIGDGCTTKSQIPVSVNRNADLSAPLRISGLVSQYDWGHNKSVYALDEGEFWVLNFTGTCLGLFDDLAVWTRGMTMGVANYTNITGGALEL
ncbi:hypothetical protein PFICI_09202 [Pestalotiopsis fici W106-1]|uniref:Uncharacterized protein n=1 Tax=Pestalotiopsis fici (strain W106-1 / CGMCC3.15140) TaxID=1229662 RepID=W3X007_PESFW|nr:uncharacterized protein PFICI_09202 [Pestalotiopsis fici W106-1]ETS79349.1 hypothetical protein PFICI_09202 [Pestalotiopsis fici W106-1]